MRIVAAACVLAMLYFGRVFLAPLALAAILSLVIAPLKRKLARIGLGHTAGALVSVVLAGAALAAVTAVLASQLVTVAADLRNTGKPSGPNWPMQGNSRFARWRSWNRCCAPWPACAPDGHQQAA